MDSPQADIHTFLLSNNLTLIQSPGDGHCLLHSTISSLHLQLGQNLTLEALKAQIYTESINNMNEYINFIKDSSRSLFSTYLRQYLLYKNYNNSYGDIVPLIIANTLGVKLVIIDESCNSCFKLHEIAPRSIPIHIIFLHRKQDHYNGIKKNSASSLCIHPSNHQYSSATTSAHQSRDNSVQPIRSGEKPQIRYTSDDLRKLSGHHHINRQIRKKLFKHHLWRPKATRRKYDLNRGVHHNLLKSLQKSNIAHHQPAGLHCAMVNTCSIRNKADDFINHSTDADYDLCFITETWLQDNNPIDDAICKALNTDTHDFISCPRSSKNRGGGIGIFYKKNLKVKLLQHHIHSTFEMCLTNIQAKVENFMVLTVYRPPYSTKNRHTVNMFITEFSDVCTTILSDHTDKRLLILGDFNIHMDEPTSTDTATFTDLLNTFNWHQLVNDTTHTSGHIIDLCIKSTEAQIQISNPVVDYFISDHAFISFNIKIPRPPIHKSLIKYRAISRINDNSFRQDLISLVNDLKSSEIQDVTRLATNYDSKMTALLDKHAPQKSKFITPRTCVAWFDKNAKVLKAKLRKQEKVWRKKKDPEELIKFKAIKKEYRHLIHSNKISHFNKSIKEATGNPKQLFAITMGLMGKTKTNQLPITNDDKALANEFADYFISKIEKIRLNLCQSPNYTPGKSATSDFSAFAEVSNDTVLKVIQASKPTTCATDPLPSSLLKKHADVITNLVTRIINQSLVQNTFCDNWKQATVQPLLKKSGLETTLNNYRPVSNLSFISKIAEKIVVSQLNTYLSNHNLHSNHQSAYKQCFSTETALCALTNHLLWSLEQGRATTIVALDLSAAFDTVDHDILITVLNSCFGISHDALDWFSSYLKDRRLCVRIRNSNSDNKCFNFSVPQGSCLGPVLFNLYCSTITECISSEQNLGGYADDHCLIDSFNPINPQAEVDCNTRIETTLKKICTWMAANKLKMNPAKTEILTVATKSSSNKIQHKFIEVDQEQVPISDHLKYLGVWLDSHLSFEKHINSKCSAACINIRSIAAIRRFIDLDTAKLLASSLVLTHLDYSNSILCGLPKKSILKLQRIQNWAAKVVLHRDKYSSSTDALITLHWLPIKERIDFKILCLVFKSINNMAPQYLSSLLKIKSFPRNTRASTRGITLEVPKVKKATFAARSFSVYGPKLWNSLPPLIHHSPSYSVFKNKVKTELFNQAFNLSDASLNKQF